MKENKKLQTDRKRNTTQSPVQPEKPVGNITSSNDNIRLPEQEVNTPPDEQTKGNP